MEKLPDEWIETIFMAMRATYGTAFDRQFEPPTGSDKAESDRFYLNLKAWWKRELIPAFRAPHTLRYALDNLPPRVPNLIEFKALCWQAPPLPRQPDQQQIERDKTPADPERVAAELSRMRQVQATSPKAWAYRLKELEERGGNLTAAQRDMWRAALNVTNAPAA